MHSSSGCDLTVDIYIYGGGFGASGIADLYDDYSILLERINGRRCQVGCICLGFQIAFCREHDRRAMAECGDDSPVIVPNSYWLGRRTTSAGFDAV